ncbi:MAG: hypothetical protein PHF57_07545 [Methanoregula sp.]|nr:hypothetical protein [Methanoregula sp.]
MKRAGVRITGVLILAVFIAISVMIAAAPVLFVQVQHPCPALGAQVSHDSSLIPPGQIGKDEIPAEKIPAFSWNNRSMSGISDGAVRNGYLPGAFSVIHSINPIPGLKLPAGNRGLPISLTNLMGTQQEPDGITPSVPAEPPRLPDVHETISPIAVTTVTYLGSQQFTITPDPGYHIENVFVDGEAVGAVPAFLFTNVRANHTIQARFGINSYTITPSAGHGGSILPRDPVIVEYGGIVDLLITPETGYHIADVFVDGVSIGSRNEYTFMNIEKNHTLSASFAINRFAITTLAGSGGTIEPSGPVQASYGSSRTFSILPDDGYHIATVSVDGSPAGSSSSYTFVDILTPHTLSATFAPNPVIARIDPPGGKNGQIRQFTITGTGFVTSGVSRVGLYYPGTSTVFVDGDSIRVASPTRITGHFVLPVWQSHRYYDVRVTNPDGSSAIQPSGFEVT